MFIRRHWIPPGALIFAQLAHGASWLILGWAALAGPSWSLDFPAIAWIHTVALGWATVAATAVLLHVIPQFADVEWRLENLARRSVFVFAIGVALFVGALLTRPPLAIWGAGLIVLALIGYCTAAGATLLQTLRGPRTERAIGRALATTLAFLFVTALLGLGLAFMLSGYAVPAWMAAVPAAHANLGMFGWLSLLVFGVSARTADNFLSVFLLAVAIGTLVGGPIGDRVGRKRVIWFSIVGITPFTLALPYVNLAWTIGLSVVIGLVLASAFPAIIVYAQDMLTHRIGMVSGLFYGFSFGLGGIGAAVLGVVADHYSIAFVYQVCAFLPLLGLSAAFLPDVRPPSDKSVA